MRRWNGKADDSLVACPATDSRLPDRSGPRFPMPQPNIDPRQATVPDAAAGRRFDAVLAELFPEYSRSRLAAWIKSAI